MQGHQFEFISYMRVGEKRLPGESPSFWAGSVQITVFRSVFTIHSFLTSATRVWNGVA